MNNTQALEVKRDSAGGYKVMRGNLVVARFFGSDDRQTNLDNAWTYVEENQR